MKRKETMSNVTTVGLDIAKNTFPLVQLDESGEIMMRRKLRRAQLEKAIRELPGCVLAMEACGSAHFWRRKFEAMGDTVKLLPPQHVKGYLRGQKNDFNDARAIAESSIHAAIRPVALKTIEQQDEQAQHRIRSLLIRDRVALGNHIRSFLYERGIVLRMGISVIKNEVPGLLEDAENDLTDISRELLARLYQQFERFTADIRWFTQRIEKQTKEDDVANRLMDIPGIGVIGASALKGWMGDGHQFQKGRDASAALGIVPRQDSTGGKEKLLGITKKGDPYVRALVVHGARSVVARSKNRTDPLSQWINQIRERRGYNKAVIALANKLVRMAWVIIARGEHYQPRTAAA
jgi:transposase